MGKKNKISCDEFSKILRKRVEKFDEVLIKNWKPVKSLFNGKHKAARWNDYSALED